MISFDAGQHRFNFRAATVILRDGFVLLHRIEGDAFWCLPGGRVEPGEIAADAVVREMQEELGVQVSAGPLLWVVENFFSHAGQRHHELGLYFLARLAPDSNLLASPGPYAGCEGGLRLTFDWFECSSLAEVDLRPVFLVDALATHPLAFRHVIQRDAEPMR
jgi:8-oxo-dGTP pyrophosphatase MutT (NUDIX family)